jgi:hypothetical protein
MYSRNAVPVIQVSLRHPLMLLVFESFVLKPLTLR